MLGRERKQELTRGVNALTEPDRSNFWRRYFYYESLDELAAAYCMTKKAVENRLYRCRTVLKQALRANEAKEANIRENDEGTGNV